VCHNETELEDPKGLQASFRKYLILTNERKQMSKTTLRKRISLVATTALVAGMLSFAATPVAHAAAGDANIDVTDGTDNGSLFVATAESTGTTGVVHSATDLASTNGDAAALSKGLLVKDSTSGTAQTATMLTSGVLSLYAPVTTTAAMTASGGKFSAGQQAAGTGAATTTGVTYSANNYTVLFSGLTAASPIAALWTAPSSAGTYTLGLYVGNGVGTLPSLASPQVTLAGQITVTVVATSAGGSYSAAYSACNIATVVATATGIDSDTRRENGQQWYINFDLDDGYDVSLGSGNIVATATNGALLEFGTSTATAGAGTSSTKVEYGSSQNRSIRIDQPTAGAPVTTTVTISFNGTNVCTKTVTIRGEVASLEIGDLLTGDLSSANGSTLSNRDGTDRTGQFGYFVAKDSAGNIVQQSHNGTVAADSATLTPLITAMTLVVGTSSSTSNNNYRGTIAWTCGATASTAQLKFDFTNTTSGKVVKSPAFAARCADNPYRYTASWDRASYIQGDLAKLTVKFTDIKGNPANSLNPGASIITAPMMTLVSTTGSATAILTVDGTVEYTYSVGLATGVTAGKYTSTVDFSSLTAVAASVATPTYNVSTGITTVTNEEVLKSIVALIASINKQIQALQKLILKR
jgi:hypothetical protein